MIIEKTWCWRGRVNLPSFKNKSDIVTWRGICTIAVCLTHAVYRINSRSPSRRYRPFSDCTISTIGSSNISRKGVKYTCILSFIENSSPPRSLHQNGRGNVLSFWINHVNTSTWATGNIFSLLPSRGSPLIETWVDTASSPQRWNWEFQRRGSP